MPSEHDAARYPLMPLQFEAMLQAPGVSEPFDTALVAMLGLRGLANSVDRHANYILAAYVVSGT